MLKTSTAIAALLVLLLVGSYVYQDYQKKHQFKSAGEVAQFLATAAVEDAIQNDHVALDYSPESIRVVETILSGVHDRYAKNPPSINANGLASAYGAYIGEVVRRSEKNARWEQDDPVSGQKSYPLHWGGRVSFPMTWCYKRIVNGPEDNVWDKYLALKQHAAEISAKRTEHIESLVVQDAAKRQIELPMNHSRSVARVLSRMISSGSRMATRL